MDIYFMTQWMIKSSKKPCEHFIPALGKEDKQPLYNT